MLDTMSNLSKNCRQRVQEIAEELASYGLGIYLPHMHVNGAFASLPEGLIARETDQQVTFVPADDASSDAIPVGWRWVDGELQVWADCCAAPPAPPPFRREGRLHDPLGEWVLEGSIFTQTSI